MPGKQFLIRVGYVYYSDQLWSRQKVGGDLHGRACESESDPSEA